ncbi:MAG: type II secretion system protein [Candidatus Saccharicenans sp.]|nr:MAG: general secretion pathway protein GspG [Candidatus Aminicenantes bacterium]HEK85947.1 type II secretion system protein [Candidatus Aminicenantes bacterium]
MRRKSTVFSSNSANRAQGFTLLEMVVTLAILAILTSVAIPIITTSVKREKEAELRENLRLIREAIDQYKKLADEKKIKVEPDSYGYPPDLETLVKGVEVEEEITDPSGKKSVKKVLVRFLRRIPRDPMTDSYEWGLRSYQDDPDSDNWGGQNVYDVYTKSQAKALDGSKYHDW